MSRRQGARTGLSKPREIEGALRGERWREAVNRRRAEPVLTIEERIAKLPSESRDGAWEALRRIREGRPKDMRDEMIVIYVAAYRHVEPPEVPDEDIFERVAIALAVESTSPDGAVQKVKRLWLRWRNTWVAELPRR